MATLNEVIIAARDLAYDRFTTPTFYIQNANTNFKANVSATRLEISDSSKVNGGIAISVFQEATTSLKRIFKITFSGTITGTYSLSTTSDYEEALSATSSPSANLTASINAEILSNPTGAWATSVLSASYVSATEMRITLKDNGVKLPIYIRSDYTKVFLDFVSFPTIKSVTDALNEDLNRFSLSYSASWIPSDPSNSLLTLSSTPISEAIPIFRKYFFSDERVILRFVQRYFMMVLQVSCADMKTIDLETEVSQFTCQRPDHMSTWIAYWMVNERRMFEMAAEMLGQSTFSFSNQQGIVGVSSTNGTVEMSIGDVFRLTDNTNQDDYNERENPAGIGADNVLGDAKSFWYKLELWLRSLLERLYGDYSLRQDNVMMGNISLEKNQNFYAYFDNYPYTISPLAREVMSSFESNL